jgi:hypothetical protein
VLAFTRHFKTEFPQGLCISRKYARVDFQHKKLPGFEKTGNPGKTNEWQDPIRIMRLLRLVSAEELTDHIAEYTIARVRQAIDQVRIRVIEHATRGKTNCEQAVDRLRLSV